MTTTTDQDRATNPALLNGGTPAAPSAPLTLEMRAQNHIRMLLGEKDFQIAVLRAQLDEALEKIKAMGSPDGACVAVRGRVTAKPSA